jgi:hypothetical protein
MLEGGRLLGRYRQGSMANLRGEIPVQVLIDDRQCEAHSTYGWQGGGMVLSFSTVLPEQGLALELISTYVGHPQTVTIATHLLLGPVGHRAQLHASEHPHDQLDPVEAPRACAYDHADQLIEALHALGHEASVRLNESSFVQLERVE